MRPTRLTSSETHRLKLSTHHLKRSLMDLVRPRYRSLFSTDASNGYWAIPIKAGDEYKAGFVSEARLFMVTNDGRHSISLFRFGQRPKHQVTKVRINCTRAACLPKAAFQSMLYRLRCLAVYSCISNIRMSSPQKVEVPYLRNQIRVTLGEPRHHYL